MLTFDWYEDALVFLLFIFIFCLEPTVRKDTCMSDFHHCYDNFEIYLITAMFKVPSQRAGDKLTTAFWKTSYSWRCYRNGSTYMLILSSWINIMLILSTWINIMKRKAKKVLWKLSVEKKPKPVFLGIFYFPWSNSHKKLFKRRTTNQWTLSLVDTVLCTNWSI